MLQEDQMLKGRQVLWMILQSYKIGNVAGEIKGFGDLNRLRLDHNDLEAYNHKWDAILLQIEVPPPDYILEALYRQQVAKCSDFRDHYDRYDWLLPKDNQKCYKTFKELVRRHLETKAAQVGSTVS